MPKMTNDSSFASAVDPARLPDHSHFAGRQPAGSEQSVTIAKNGVRHVSEGLCSRLVCTVA